MICQLLTLFSSFWAQVYLPATPVQSQNVQCGDYLACVDEIWVSSLSDLYCYGYLSCYDSIIGYENEIELWSEAVASAVLVQGLSNTMLKCAIRGSLGCLFCDLGFDSDISSSYIYPHASFSSVYSTYTINDAENEAFYITAYGYAAFIKTRIDSVDYMTGSGYYGLYGSSITFSNYDSSSYIKLSGRLNGYGATMTCPDSATCRLTCSGPTSCYGLSFICESGASCDVDCAEEWGIWCPNEYSNNTLDFEPLWTDIEFHPNKHAIFGSLITRLDEYKNNSLTYNALYFDSLISSYFDDICFDKCTNYTDCYQCTYDIEVSSEDVGATNESNLCFLGASSGVNSYGINISHYNLLAGADTAGASAYEDIIAGNIYATGKEALRSGTTLRTVSNNDGSVISCEGYYACSYNDLISNANHLLCLATLACYSTTVIAIPNVYLLASSAGQNLNVYSNDTFDGRINIYIDAYGAGKNMNVYCYDGHTCIIYCFDKNLTCVDEEWGIDWFCSENANCSVLYYNAAPTMMPTMMPTMIPSMEPSLLPTNMPSMVPSVETTDMSTDMPTNMDISGDSDDDDSGDSNDGGSDDSNGNSNDDSNAASVVNVVCLVNVAVLLALAVLYE